MREPFFWSARDCWYVWIGGKQVRLDPNKEKAYSLWAEKLAAATPESPSSPVASICEAFLEFSSRNHAAGTYKWYVYYLSDFCKHVQVATKDLKPFHVTRWLQLVREREKGRKDKDGKRPVVRELWSDASQRAAICAVKAAFGWAARESLIAVNPVANIRKPPARHRETIVSVDVHHKIAADADAPFRLFLTALRHTGCRPGELARLEAANVSPDGGAWVFRQHKTAKRTGKPRVIYLSPCMATLTRILTAARPSGPLLLNARGGAWKKNAIKNRFQRLRESEAIPAGTVAYSYRHTYTTDGLVNGVPLALMAELLGHQDARMIANHYGHLEKRAEQMRAAAAAVTSGVAGRHH